MKIAAKALNAAVEVDGTMRVSVAVDKDYETAVKAQADKLAGKRLSVEVKPWRKGRSLDANAYFWVLVGKIAIALETGTDDVYLDLLQRYGRYTHIIAKPEAVPRIKLAWRLVRELGSVKVNGKRGVQLQCYYGSHTYDSAEMARLIDGTILEAQDLGIDILPPADVEQMKGAWGQDALQKQEG